MLAVSTDRISSLAAVAAVVLVMLAFGSAWLMKTIVQKLVLAAVLGLLAVAVWTQRAAVRECADRVRTEAAADGTNLETDCTFFGRQVSISTGRAD